VKPEQASKGKLWTPTRPEFGEDEGSGLNGAARQRSRRESDRVIVPLKPGNAGGGKDPDFWYVFEANEVR
jgi:hypothetical protein